MPPARKTLAVLIDRVDHQTGGYESQLRNAFDEATRRLDANLLVIVGRALEEPDPSQAVQNAVYDLIHPDCVDGVILMAGSLASHAGLNGVADLCKRLPRLALCSVGAAIAGVPAVLHDSRAAMEALVEHVTGVHGCRRVAYLGGPPNNPDARIRFEVFCDVMKRGGLRLERDLVRHGPFTTEFGRQATRELVSGGVGFDALVAANDCLALGALEALRGAGVRVPRDVLVTGFDDLVIARLANPPLTTVRQPLERMAELAVELVMAQIGGRPVPPRVDLPGEFMARNSCGCDLRSALRPSMVPLVGPDSPADFLERHEKRLARLLSSSARMPRTGVTRSAEQLVQGLRAELTGQREAFLTALEELLEEVGDRTDAYEDIQTALSLLWVELWPVTTFELEALWHEARRAVGIANSRAEAQRRCDLESAYLRLLRIGDRLSSAVDLPLLRRLLQEEMPQLGLTDAYVALQTDPGRSELTPFFVLRDGESDDPLAIPSSARGLLPFAACADPRRRGAFVMPLTSETQQLGVVVFDFGAPSAICDMLREQLSSAFKNVSMRAEIVQKTALHERSVHERLATAERMKSLSVLAGGVAHDLNNALGPLVALPDVIRSELDTQFGDRAGQLLDVLDDLGSIKSGALRASQTIKDLLTLSRQGQTRKEPLDLNPAVSNVVSAERVDLNRKEASGVVLTVELADAPLVVRGSASHLERAVSNLVRNAIEALAGTGQVTLRTAPVRVIEPCVGYELIEPGDYAVITVADTGKGIPQADLKRVFEPFFTHKRLSGSSGSGLGLAIVHGVVKEHGGFLDVESRVGEGTTFSLFFPRVDDVLRSAKLPRLPAVESARILVVDDDPAQLRTASRVLRRLGYDVVTVDSGAKALALFEPSEDRSARPSGSPDPPADLFDLVIMDLVLHEGQNGIEVLARIRGLNRQQKAVIATGHAPQVVRLGASQPPLAWLSKPYTADTLAQVVAQALGRVPA